MSTESLSCGSKGWDSKESKPAVDEGNWEPSDADHKVDYKAVEIDKEHAIVQIGGKVRVVD